MSLVDKDFKQPCVFNVYKPRGVSSQHVVKILKRKIGNKKLKIGHFGTLDPFAEGVLLIGINGASRMNDYVHSHLPKTYLAKGILGKKTITGDLTGEEVNSDTTDYLKTVISQFDKKFIETQLKERFEGDYLQAPPAFSAAKFEGKKLHEWAREGVIIQKEKKLRHIYKIEVVNYQFPYLEIRFQVSSGTYIRTLFEDCAQHLGTLGHLYELIRENIGDVSLNSTINPSEIEQAEYQLSREDFLRPAEVLPLPKVQLSEGDALFYSQGRSVMVNDYQHLEGKKVWVTDKQDELIGMASLVNSELKTLFNFSYAIDSIQQLIDS